jgi:Major royal jelly protein
MWNPASQVGEAGMSNISLQGNRPPLERWRSYAGVSWDAPQGGASPAPFADSVNSPICGVHFDAKGRVFVSTPRLVSARSPATLSILDIRARTGPARLSAFPSVESNAVGAPPDQNLRSVLGFYIDKSNGWLWALDQGFVAGESEAPAGAQKVMIYDLQTGRLVRRIGLDDVADRKGSFLNDVAVDEARKIAYISDSGSRSAPAEAGIIVVDLDAGGARRVLDRDRTVSPQPGVMVVSHGAEVWPGRPLVLGINGIALSPDRDTLYWTVTSGRNAFSAPTEILRDAKASDAAASAMVIDLGDVGGNTDGVVTDAGRKPLHHRRHPGRNRQVRPAHQNDGAGGVRYWRPLVGHGGDRTRRRPDLHLKQPEPAPRRGGAARRRAIRALAPAPQRQISAPTCRRWVSC